MKFTIHHSPFTIVCTKLLNTCQQQLFYLLAILALGFLITFQIAKASEYVSILKGEKKAFEQSNRINAFLMVAFLVLGLIGVYWCNKLYFRKTLMALSFRIRSWRKDRHHDVHHHCDHRCCFCTYPILVILVFVINTSTPKKEKHIIILTIPNWEILWTTVPAIALCVLGRFWFILLVPDNR